ncbi:MAG: hypothetical protein JOY66_16045 [Acetobacteraceae bacterium]|nr:hypothetical protein [Acetobacteraceae bacterium]
MLDFPAVPDAGSLVATGVPKRLRAAGVVAAQRAALAQVLGKLTGLLARHA